MRSSAPNAYSTRSGFTLLEVVVGTVLLASLVTGVLMAMGAHQKKLHFARQKAVAVQVADNLLMTWDQSATGIPLQAVGATEGRLSWQTNVINSRLLCNVPVHVVRLSVFGEQKSSKAGRPLTLCEIDVVVDATKTPAGVAP